MWTNIAVDEVGEYLVEKLRMELVNWTLMIGVALRRFMYTQRRCSIGITPPRPRKEITKNILLAILSHLNTGFSTYPVGNPTGGRPQAGLSENSRL